MGWFDDNPYDESGGAANDWPLADGSIAPLSPQVQPPLAANALPPGAAAPTEMTVAAPPGAAVWSPSTVAAAPGSGIDALYQKYYGTTPDATTKYYAQGNPGGLPALEAMMKADPNAQAYLASQAAKAAPAGAPPVSGAKLESNNLTAPGLLDLLGNSPLLAPWTQAMPSAMTTPFDPGAAFKQPTMADLQDPNNPVGEGYRFTLQQGIDALQKSAAAKGTLLTGGMMKGLTEYATGLADSTYQQQFNNAYQTYFGNLGSKYQTWAGNQTQAAQNYGTEYNMYRGNQTQPFNMLMALSNGGQAATANLNTAGMGVGQSAGDTMTGIGNAQAAGQVGQGNAVGSALTNAGNNAMLWSLMQSSSYKPKAGG